MNIQAAIAELDKIVNEHPVLRNNEQRIRVKFNDLRRILIAMQCRGEDCPEHSKLDRLVGKQVPPWTIPDKDHKHYCDHTENPGQKNLETGQYDSSPRRKKLDRDDIAKIVRVYSGWDIGEEQCTRIADKICADYGDK